MTPLARQLILNKNFGSNIGRFIKKRNDQGELLRPDWQIKRASQNIAIIELTTKGQAGKALQKYDADFVSVIAEITY